MRPVQHAGRVGNGQRGTKGGQRLGRSGADVGAVNDQLRMAKPVRDLIEQRGLLNKAEVGQGRD